MIMRPGQQLLLPANPLFIWSSLVAALGITLLQNMSLGVRAAWLPDLVALVLVFWTVHQPRIIGMTVAFTLGLVLDVHQSTLLGQHAMAYSALSFMAMAIHRRLLWFSMPLQAAQVLLLFVAAHALTCLVRLMAGHGWPDWTLCFSPILEALMWPVVSVLLLLPQKRAPDPDAHRPL